MHQPSFARLTLLLAVFAFVVHGFGPSPAQGQLSDTTQTPNAENAGAHKSLEEQIGAGQGDLETLDGSIYLIGRDPFRSIRRGRQLFQRKFTLDQGLGPRTNHGHGDIEADASIVAGLADSCAACHGRPRGSAGFGGDVFTRPDSRDAPHLFGLGLQEMLADEITGELRAIRDGAVRQAASQGRTVRRQMTSKGIGFGLIEVAPDGSVDASGLQGIDSDLRVRPFFAEGSTVSIREFIVGALNAEMGLEAYDPVLAAAVAGELVETPSGMVLDGSLDAFEAPPVTSETDDGDFDGVVNEIDPAVVDHLEFYLLNYFKPGSYDRRAAARGPGSRQSQEHRGLQRMRSMNCTSCHVADLRIDQDRRVADVETQFDPSKGIFNRLFSTASARFDEVDDGTGLPTLKQPQGNEFLVKNFFADFKRHDLGPAFWERNFDGTLQKEFLTEPLWGVGSTAPYGHDGRSINLEEVILRHGGEAQASRNAFARARAEDQELVLEFLQTLVLFPPDDTASNLDPGDPDNPDFPQRGHGSIALAVLFNDPDDIE